MGFEQDKRVKTSDGEDDRISALPQDVLSHILSLLPTKFSARTCVLSTLFKNIFASLPDLDFDDSLVDVTCDHNKTLFLCFITNVFHRRNFSPINKIQLRCSQLSLDTRVMSAWINYIIFSKVQEIVIDVLMDDFATPLPLLFTLKTLTTLHLCGKFIIDVPDYSYLPQLKNMHMEQVKFRDDDSARRLFSHCPVLEDLNIWCCDMGSINVLKISVPSLKRFMFYGNEGLYEIVLNAVNLEELTFSATHGVWRASKLMLKSLFRAVFFIEPEFHVSNLVERICDVRSLSLSGGAMEALFGIHQPLPIFRNLTSLELFPDHNIGWRFLPSVLANSPCLELLSFSRGLQDRSGNFLEVANYLCDPVPTCVSKRLKEVNIGNFYGEEEEYQMVEYFLNNAEVLEKIAICPSPPPYEDRSLSKEDKFQITKELLNLPRCSSTCRIVLISPDEC